VDSITEASFRSYIFWRPTSSLVFQILTVSAFQTPLNFSPNFFRVPLAFFFSGGGTPPFLAPFLGFVKFLLWSSPPLPSLQAILRCFFCFSRFLPSLGDLYVVSSLSEGDSFLSFP